MLGLYAILMSGGVVLVVFLQSDYLPRNMLAGLSLIYLESMLVMTISLAGSSTMPALATGGMVFGMYGLAFLGGWIEQIGSLANNPAAVQIGIVTSLVVPTEALWRRAARSSDRASKRIRCLRRAPSRKRLVVMRCSQPSKVPGV